MIYNYLLYTLILILIFSFDLLFSLFFNNNEEKDKIIFKNNSKTDHVIDKNENNYYYNDDDIDDLNQFNFFNFENVEQNDDIQNCFSLLIEFNSCLFEKNHINDGCQKLIEENMIEFEKCDVNYFSGFFEEYKNLIENNAYLDEDILFELLKEYEVDEEGEHYKEFDNQKKIIIEEIIKKSSFLNNNKDCIEYELSKEDDNVLECVK